MIEPGSVHPDLQDRSENPDAIQPDNGPGQVYGVARAIFSFELECGPVLERALKDMAWTLVKGMAEDARLSRSGVWRVQLQAAPWRTYESLFSQEATKPGS